VDPRNHVLNGVNIPHGKGQFLGVICWPTAENGDYNVDVVYLVTACTRPLQALSSVTCG